jgi:hypothetical protein
VTAPLDKTILGLSYQLLLPRSDKDISSTQVLEDASFLHIVKFWFSLACSKLFLRGNYFSKSAYMSRLFVGFRSNFVKDSGLASDSRVCAKHIMCVAEKSLSYENMLCFYYLIDI